MGREASAKRDGAGDAQGGVATLEEEFGVPPSLAGGDGLPVRQPQM